MSAPLHFNRLQLVDSYYHEDESKVRAWAARRVAALKGKGHKPRVRTKAAVVRAFGKVFTLHVAVIREAAE